MWNESEVVQVPTWKWRVSKTVFEHTEKWLFRIISTFWTPFYLNDTEIEAESKTLRTRKNCRQAEANGYETEAENFDVDAREST